MEKCPRKVFPLVENWRELLSQDSVSHHLTCSGMASSLLGSLSTVQGLLKVLKRSKQILPLEGSYFKGVRLPLVGSNRIAGSLVVSCPPGCGGHRPCSGAQRERSVHSALLVMTPTLQTLSHKLLECILIPTPSFSSSFSSRIYVSEYGGWVRT
jgi:hypothetical protein